MTLPRRPFSCAMWAALLCTGLPVSAQEALRMRGSLPNTGRGYRGFGADPGYYNVKLGPVGWAFGANFSAEYNDNVNLQESASSGDIILRPSISAEGLWPISEINRLTLNFNVGYAAYMENPDRSGLFVSPGSTSEIALDLYVGKILFNIHERLSITESAHQDPTVASIQSYSRLNNTTGVQAIWPLNDKTQVSLGYDHLIEMPLQSSLFGGGEEQQSASDADTVNASVSHEFLPQFMAGVQSQATRRQFDSGESAYAGSSYSDLSTGLFCQWTLSEYTRLSASVGYFMPLTELENSGAGQIDGAMFFDVAMQQQVNRYISLNLSAGRTSTIGFYGSPLEMYYLRTGMGWKIIRNLSLSTSFDVNQGTQYGDGTEDFLHYGGSVGLGLPLGKKTSSSLTYRIYQRDSGQQGRSYTENAVILSVSYRF